MVIAFAKHDVSDKLRNPRKEDDPNVDVAAPELIVKSSRVLQPEDKHVTTDKDGIQKEHVLKRQSNLDIIVEETCSIFQWVEHVPNWCQIVD